MASEKHIVRFEEVGIKDVGLVGGKNASLGEMIRTLAAKGVPVPSGFVVTAPAYFYFLEKTGLDKFIKSTLKGLDTKNLKELHRCGSAVRNAIMKTEFPEDLAAEIARGYRELEKRYGKNADVAVRSSATAEDLPGASFAGEQESYLGIRGPQEVLKAVRATMASLFTDRAISYREDRGFDHFKIGLSAGVQKMVRSDRACSGVMFSLDTESGFPNVVLINGSWGLGEMIVKGEVTPDEFFIWKGGLEQNVSHPIIEKKLGVKLRKMIYHHGGAIQQTKIVRTTPGERDSFVLTDKEVAKLARWAVIIEKHYTDHYKKWTPMDMEWAKDGVTGELFIVQARPETIHAGRDFSKVKEYLPLETKPVIVTGASVGSKIASGKAHVILDERNMDQFRKGEILVTDMTSPDWEPTMKLAAAIVTDKGGRTCFGGETQILTDEGFLNISEVYQRIKQGKTLRTLSLDARTNKIVWRLITDAFARSAVAMKVIVGATVRNKENSLEVTQDHEFLTLEDRKLKKAPVRTLVESRQSILAADQAPALGVGRPEDPENWYLRGALMTDGFTMKNKQGGYVAGFTQKLIPEKEEFIGTVRQRFEQVHGQSLSLVVDRRGNWGNFLCYRKEIYQTLIAQKKNVIVDILMASENDLQEFLGGALDGDGNVSDHQIQLTVGTRKIEVLQAVMAASLRLGILPTVCRRKTWFVISFDKAYANTLLKYSRRLRMAEQGRGTSGSTRRRRKRFVSRMIIKDIISMINHRGSIAHDYLTENNMLTGYKIDNTIMPRISDARLRSEFESILESDFTMQKIRAARESLRLTDVYNFSIEAENELDHNYVVFTLNYTPIIVGNCHAAIVSRELGIPCVVGTEKATKLIKTGDLITVDTTGSAGNIYRGALKFKVVEHDLKKIPKPHTKVMVNVAIPDSAFETSFLPNQGVGLAREEFIIASKMGLHPMALLNLSKQKPAVRRAIEEKMRGWNGDAKKYYIDNLAFGIAKIGAAFYPHHVIVRFSDFKTNEYRTLLGGEMYEPREENPMIGWRGASRYYDPKFKPAFLMEVEAVKKVREDMGLANVIPMVPFCRTVEEGIKVQEAMAEAGLYTKYTVNAWKRLRHAVNGKKPAITPIYVMCEIPSNVLSADKFLDIFDGMSIGSNDLTQLTMGLDRDSGIVTKIANEKNPAVERLIAEVIEKCRARKKYIGICGQGPSDYPDFAEFLVEKGIESMSLNPDTVVRTTVAIARKEKESKKR